MINVWKIEILVIDVHTSILLYIHFSYRSCVKHGMPSSEQSKHVFRNNRDPFLFVLCDVQPSSNQFLLGREGPNRWYMFIELSQIEINTKMVSTMSVCRDKVRTRGAVVIEHVSTPSNHKTIRPPLWRKSLILWASYYLDIGNRIPKRLEIMKKILHIIQHRDNSLFDSHLKLN